MEETITQVQEKAEKFVADTQAHAESAFKDAAEKGKGMFEKGTKLAEDAMTFHKENVEAVVASSKIAAAGAEKVAQYFAEQGRTSFDKASAAFKAAAATKTPADFFTVQNDYAKSAFENLVAESSKASEATLKFFGDVFQPLSNRYAVAAEKAKSFSAL
ncbi:MAG: TIGR01841 family phasin [Alphaproteobacteria bacterium]|nr:TIGR01841 family phasin [Alphaproteobacteria bacterium]